MVGSMQAIAGTSDGGWDCSSRKVVTSVDLSSSVTGRVGGSVLIASTPTINKMVEDSYCVTTYPRSSSRIVDDLFRLDNVSGRMDNEGINLVLERMLPVR